MDRILNQSQKDAVIAQRIRTPEGRYIIGQTLIEPFKLGRDYMSVGRKLLAVDQLAVGAPMWYDKDPQFTAVVLSQDGMVPYEVVTGDRVYQDPFTISVLVRVPVQEVAYRRFNMLDREQKRGRIEMQKKEDVKIFAAIDAGARSATGHNEVLTSNAGTTRGTILDLIVSIEDHNVPPMSLLMHPRQYRDIRAWGRNDFDPVTMLEMRKTGYVGDLYGINVRTSYKVPKGKVYVIGEPQYYGVLSVRIDLDQWDSPDTEKLQFGWIFYELVSVVVAIAQGSAVCDVTGKVS